VEASETAEKVARLCYGRLVAYLAARWHDLAAAEDAVSEALHAALGTWPRSGVPKQPEAWLLTVARRKLIDEHRRTYSHDRAAETLRLMGGEANDEAANTFPDERLKLLFVCTHPAIDRAVHTALMLQVVLGLDTARIAAAFLIAPSAMSQRLVRAKAKIRDAGIAFEVPEKEQLTTRLDAVLAALYVAYGAGWEDIAAAAMPRPDLVDEVLWLARLIVELLPGEPEAKGLLSLMLYCEARRRARRTPDGAFVPLSVQDTKLWSRSMLAEAETLLFAASRVRRLGRFQLEAAVQSAHAERAWGGSVDWAALAQLYQGLLSVAPSVGALLGHAAAVAEAQGAERGFALLEEMPQQVVANHQPYWALRGHLLKGVGRFLEASQAYERAISFTEDRAIGSFLRGRLIGALEQCWDEALERLRREIDQARRGSTGR
jgi:RNA polymerase sigma-70 factor (ECF subfamily)